MVKVRKSWQFAWYDPESPPKNGDSHDIRSKIFYCSSFDKAMDKMLKYVINKTIPVYVDYECCAMHIQYDKNKHEESFPRIDHTDHELKQYVG